MLKEIQTYCAVILGSLLLSVAFADAQITITQPLEGEVSSFRNQAVIGSAPADAGIRLDINDTPIDSGVVRIDGVFEFLGVPTPEGPVTYTVTVRT